MLIECVKFFMCNAEVELRFHSNLMLISDWFVDICLELDDWMKFAFFWFLDWMFQILFISLFQFFIFFNLHNKTPKKILSSNIVIRGKRPELHPLLRIGVIRFICNLTELGTRVRKPLVKKWIYKIKRDSNDQVERYLKKKVLISMRYSLQLSDLSLSDLL